MAQSSAAVTIWQRLVDCTDISWIVGNGPPIEKSRSMLRWLILVFACLMLIGSYYSVDIPAAVKTQIDDYMGDPPQYETYFSLFYTLYSVPNVILPFFGGYFVDKMGVRLSMLIFASLVGLGQVIFSIGITFKSWPIMFLGRFVFGLGGESLVVANSALLADWFKGKELAFAFGINLSIARLGSVFNNLLSPKLTASLGIAFACWFGALLCGGSVLAVVFTIPIDKAFDIKLDKLRKPLLDDHHLDLTINPMIKEGSSASTSRNPSAEKNSLWKTASFEDPTSVNSPAASAPMSWVDSTKQFVKETLSLPHVFWVLVILCVVVYGCVLPFNNIASSLLLERNYFQVPPSDCALASYGCESSTNQPNSQCPASKWYQPPLPYNVTLSDGSYYSQVKYEDVDCTSSVWADDCTVEFCDRLSSAESQASVIMSIPYIISAVMSPVLGFGIDKFGLRAVIACISPVLLVIVHSLLALTKVSPVGPLVGQGLSYTGFAAVLWPAVPIVVVEELTGLAFGIVTSALNLATAVIPVIVATVYTDSGMMYIPQVELLFVGLGAVGVAVGFYLNIYDFNHSNILNRGEDNSKKDYQAIDSQDSKHESFEVRRISRNVSVESLEGRKDRHSLGSFSKYEEVHRGGAF